jgi:serine-threonine kinase receptor-associated protein
MADEEICMGPIICLGHSKPITYLHYSNITPDGYFLTSACLDGKPMMREGKTGDWIGSFIGHKGAVWSARLNHDATLAITASGDFSAKLWNSVTGAEMITLTHNHIVKTGCFSSDSRVMLTGGKEKKIRIYDVANPAADPSVVQMQATIQHILSPSASNLMLTCGEEKGVHLLDLRTQRIERTLATNAPVTYLSLSCDRNVLSCAAGRELVFFDANTFSLQKIIPMARETTCVVMIINDNYGINYNLYNRLMIRRLDGYLILSAENLIKTAVF